MFANHRICVRSLAGPLECFGGFLPFRFSYRFHRSSQQLLRIGSLSNTLASAIFQRRHIPVIPKLSFRSRQQMAGMLVVGSIESRLNLRNYLLFGFQLRLPLP